jgi:hypothetical protein
MDQDQESGVRTTSVPPPPPPVTSSSRVFSIMDQKPVHLDKKRLWFWGGLSFVIVAAGIAYFAHVLYGGYRQASGLVAALHGEMAKQDWAGIYEASSPQYQEAMTEDQNREMFDGVDRKLGTPVSTKQQNIFMNSSSAGTTIRGSFETTFSRNATATETITWIYWGGQYRLYSYNISSLDLIKR